MMFKAGELVWCLTKDLKELVGVVERDVALDQEFEFLILSKPVLGNTVQIPVSSTHGQISIKMEWIMSPISPFFPKDASLSFFPSELQNVQLVSSLKRGDELAKQYLKQTSSLHLV